MSGFRGRTLTVIAIAAALVLAGSVAVWADGRDHDRGRHHPRFGPSVTRFDLSGYKIQTRYTLGRNTGNTFEQTYTGSTVQGVPVEGPFVGSHFDPADYVALLISYKTLYFVWLKQSPQHEIIDAFVMNFKTGVVFDYAPGSDSPESSGTVKVLKAGKNKIKQMSSAGGERADDEQSHGLLALVAAPVTRVGRQHELLPRSHHQQVAAVLEAV